MVSKVSPIVIRILKFKSITNTDHIDSLALGTTGNEMHFCPDADNVRTARYLTFC